MLVILLGVLVLIVFHYLAIDRLGGLRLIYPFQALFAKWQVSCTEGSPSWMAGLIDYVVDDQHSLSNQVVYISPEGQLYHCENGWQKGILISPVVGVDTRFRYASITKLVTADAMLARINSGLLLLDSHLLDFMEVPLPLLDERWSKITIEQLLTHRAGFDRLVSQDPMTAHAVKPWCPGDLSRISQQRLNFGPGERFAYSNLGYCLIGAVLERATNQPFRELLELEYNLAGRGMRFIDGPYLEDEVGYDFRNSNFYGENYYRYFDFMALSSSAGMSGSAVALARLIEEMLKRQPLNILSAQMDVDCNMEKVFDCFGFAVSPYQKRGSSLILYVQGGLLFGSSSKAIIDSEGGITVWLGNGMTLDPHSSAIAFVEELSATLSRYYREQ